MTAVRKVHLDEVACCALAHAFARHPQMLARWSECEGRLRLLADILPTTRSIEFTPDDQAEVVYRDFAKAELARLTTCVEATAGLRCRHTTGDHRNALEYVLRVLPGPTLQ